ncbi:MAG: phosphatase PAP2 family protein [Muribaculaceae bacterium]|nr:phosphatase PAP2 family protein [Muribaculaceae bacterium]
MIEYLDSLDQQLFLQLNGLHVSYFDVFMYSLSSRLSWILILLAFLFTLRNKGWRQAAVALLAVALTVLIADQLSSGLIKHAVERLRPSHNPALASAIHVVGNGGGQYGFVSSHAANSFGVALIVGLIMRSRPALVSLVIWAILQCYSRIYIGVHYPGDILGGVVVGLLSGWLGFVLWNWAQRRYLNGDHQLFSQSDGRLVTWAVIVSIVAVAASPLFLELIGINQIIN